MTARAHIDAVDDQLYLISLPVPIEGFDGFIGAWIHTGNPVVMVDVGPAVSVPALLSAVAELGCPAPDLILLTHIHIDHAGGIGKVAEAFPRATVVCHPKGAVHLVDPERLWQGSLKNLGDIARAYGAITPLARRQLYPAERPIHSGILAVDTPGHAAHNFCFLLNDLLFAGETGGVNLPMADGSVYLRPATPPRFFLDTNIESVDKLLALEPKRICYGHVGHRDNAMTLLQAHRDQLLEWRDMIAPFVEPDAEDDLQRMRDCGEHLLKTDPLLAGFAGLTSAEQKRERNFLLNSLKGYWGYLRQTDH